MYTAIGKLPKPALGTIEVYYVRPYRSPRYYFRLAPTGGSMRERSEISRFPTSISTLLMIDGQRDGKDQSQCVGS